MRWLNLILLLALFLTCGCAATWERSHSILNAPQIVVEVEQLMFEGKPQDAGFAHPAMLNPQGLAVFLRHLQYERVGSIFSKASKEPIIISPNDVESLAAAVTQGLAVCTPAQRVRFSVSNVHRWLPLLHERRNTRGVAFLQPADTLNLAFDLIDDAPEIDEGDELFYREWDNPTRYTVSTFNLVVPQGASTKDEGGHPLWILVPLDLITPDGEQPVVQPKVPPTPPGKGDPVKETVSGKKGEETKAEALSDEERMHRLRYLQELYEKNIITEKKYKEEWKRIFQEY